MSLYFKALIEKLRDNSPKDSTAHHLYLLGTGVNYVDRPTNIETDRSYIRGETFSYAAQLMTHVLGEEDSAVRYPDANNSKSPNYAHPYHSNSVDVINGADTPGFEVGDRLAKALMLALGAVAEGKTNLSVSGFSRGGVESIVLTHELKRVLDALEEDAKKEKPGEKRSLATIIQDSTSVPGLSLIKHPSYTRSALAGLVTAEVLEDEEALKARLLTHLKALQVNLFVLDPVPGGNVGKVVRIGWQEPSFYTLPEFVTNRFEFVQAHETSNAFKPIIPLGMPYEVIPGCHGTGDGNQFDHNQTSVPDSFGNRDLSGVQDLVLRRWIDFTFKGQRALQEPVDLGHPELDAVTNAYLPASTAERNVQLLDNYTKIQTNYPAFKWLATRNYTGLGQYMAQRQTHFRQRGNTPISDLDIHTDGKTFLNLQHVKLWMSSKLESVNFFDMTLFEQISWLQDNIKTAFTPIDMSQSNVEQTHMVSRLLQDKNNHPLVKESLSYLVSMVTQTYLRNHLSLDERERCRTCVASSFKTLDDIEQKTVVIDAQTAEFAIELNKEIRKDVTTIVVQHQNSLVLQAIKLLEDGENIASSAVSRSSDDRAVYERDGLAWLINTQKLVADLDRLKQQINGLEAWCIEPMLTQSWSTIVPALELSSEMPFEAIKEKFLRCISQQQELLLSRSSDVLKRLPDALETKPEELDRDFYVYIYQNAGMEKRESALLRANEELAGVLQQGNSRIEERTNERDRALDTLAEEQRAKAELEAALTQREESLSELTRERDEALETLAEEQRAKAELEAKVVRLAEQLAHSQKLLIEAVASVEQSESKNSETKDELVEFIRVVELLKIELDKVKEDVRQERTLLQAAKERIGLLESQVQEKDLANQELQIQVYTLQDASDSKERALEFSKETIGELQELQHTLESKESEAAASAQRASKALAEAKFKIELLLQKNEELVKENKELADENEDLAKANEGKDSDIVDGTAQNERLIKALKAEKEKSAVSVENARIMQQSDHAEIEGLRKALEAKKKEVEATAKKAITLHNEDLAEIDGLRQALDSQQKDATEAARELAEAQSKIQNAQAELATQQELVNAYKSEKEKAAIVSVAKLLERTTEYMKHLNASNHESDLLAEKKQVVQELLGHLQKPDMLPSKQLEAFNDTLKQSQETLKEHRDPAWLRFFRDCLRIITLAVSGVGFYRMLSGESPRFFKPSEGERFVDEITETTTPTNPKV